MSITTNTLNNLILDNAIIQINYTTTAAETLGATRGGASFTIERDVREIEIDGTKGPVKGARRIIGERAMITATMIEHGSTIYSKVLAGANLGVVSTSTAAPDPTITLTSDTAIADTDYLTDVAIVGTLSGTTHDVVCIVKNALGDGGLTLETVDKDETVYEIQFTGHYASTDLTAAPWEIRYPSSTMFST